MTWNCVDYPSVTEVLCPYQIISCSLSVCRSADGVAWHPAMAKFLPIYVRQHDVKRRLPASD